MPMQNEKALTPHEALELHQLLRNEMTGYKKMQSSINMVEDNELKEFIKESIYFKRENIELLQQFITAQGKLQ